MKLDEIEKFVDKLIMMKGMFSIPFILIYKDKVIRSADIAYQAKGAHHLLYHLQAEGEEGDYLARQVLVEFISKSSEEFRTKLLKEIQKEER